jgi:hypothetical protein
MGIQYTASYGVAYMDGSTPLADLDDVTRQVAESLDAAMGRAGYSPPDATTFAALVARMVTAEAKLATLEADTGWQNITMGASGFTPDSGGAPRVRKRGGLLLFTGAWTGAGMTANASFAVGQLPAGIRPQEFIGAAAPAHVNASSGDVFVNASGVVTIRTGPSVGSYYRIEGLSGVLAA